MKGLSREFGESVEWGWQSNTLIIKNITIVRQDFSFSKFNINKFESSTINHYDKVFIILIRLCT